MLKKNWIHSTVIDKETGAYTWTVPFSCRAMIWPLHAAKQSILFSTLNCIDIYFEKKKVRIRQENNLSTRTSPNMNGSQSGRMQRANSCVIAGLLVDFFMKYNVSASHAAIKVVTLQAKHWETDGSTAIGIKRNYAANQAKKDSPILFAYTCIVRGVNTFI